MKQKVLLALIALFSFVSAWADDPVVVNTDGTAGYVVFDGTNALEAADLAVSISGTIYEGEVIYAADRETEVDAIAGMGNYFLKVNNKLYAFQVAVEAPWEIIDNEDDYEESRADGTLKLYYDWADGLVPGKNGSKPYREDYWNTEERRAAGWADYHNNGEEKDDDGFYIYPNCERNWYGALDSPVEDHDYLSGWPWVCVNFSDDDSEQGYQVVFAYDGGPDAGITTVKPWGEALFGNGEGLKLWGTAQLAGEFNKPEWSIGLGTFEEEEVPIAWDIETGEPTDWDLQCVYGEEDTESYDE